MDIKTFTTGRRKMKLEQAQKIATEFMIEAGITTEFTKEELVEYLHIISEEVLEYYPFLNNIKQDE